MLWNGAPLPADLKAELEREYGRLKLVEEQIRALETERLKRLEDGRKPSPARAHAGTAAGTRAGQCLGVTDGSSSQRSRRGRN
ncbi:MAG: hypothetical protein ACREYF_03455 [Gammaproteobacteria bacterium]